MLPFLPFVSVVGAEWPQVLLFGLIFAITQNVLPQSVIIQFYPEAEAWGVGGGHWPPCSQCCLCIKDLVLVLWPTSAPQVCSLPAWDFSEASLGSAPSPRMFWAEASSAAFSQPDPICLLSFGISIHF